MHGRYDPHAVLLASARPSRLRNLPQLISDQLSKITLTLQSTKTTNNYLGNSQTSGYDPSILLLLCVWI